MNIKNFFTGKIGIGVICFFAGAFVMSAGSTESVDVSKYEAKIQELEEIIQNEKVVPTNSNSKQDSKKEVEKKQTMVYEDEKVSIYFSKVTSKGVEFLIDNKTDKQLTIQCDSVAINGFSVNQIVMSDAVSAKSKGKVIARCDTSDFDTNIEKVGGTLRIIDFEEMGSSYNANFVDIVVK